MAVNIVDEQKSLTGLSLDEHAAELCSLIGGISMSHHIYGFQSIVCVCTAGFTQLTCWISRAEFIRRITQWCPYNEIENVNMKRERLLSIFSSVSYLLSAKSVSEDEVSIRLMRVMLFYNLLRARCPSSREAAKEEFIQLRVTRLMSNNLFLS